jgi:hypothetical protein
MQEIITHATSTRNHCFVLFNIKSVFVTILQEHTAALSGSCSCCAYLRSSCCLGPGCDTRLPPHSRMRGGLGSGNRADRRSDGRAFEFRQLCFKAFDACRDVFHRSVERRILDPRVPLISIYTLAPRSRMASRTLFMLHVPWLLQSRSRPPGQSMPRR